MYCLSSAGSGTDSPGPAPAFARPVVNAAVICASNCAWVVRLTVGAIPRGSALGGADARAAVVGGNVGCAWVVCATVQRMLAAPVVSRVAAPIFIASAPLARGWVRGAVSG